MMETYKSKDFPLFKEWPPRLPPRETPMNIGGKLPRWAILTIVAVLGVLLLWLPGYYKWQWDDGISRGLGEALLIGAVLAFTIDRWFRQDFAKDVFYAAVGAVLRPEFADEMRWITDFKWLAIKSLCQIEIEDLGEGIVKFTQTINREIENISTESQEFAGYIGIDDWGIRPSEILEHAISKNGNSKKYGIHHEESEYHLSTKTDKLLVKPGEKIKVFSKFVEYKRDNDTHFLALTTPTKDPEVEIIKVPATLGCNVSFTHRGKIYEEPFVPKKTLKGTFLPSQFIVVRWWPKDNNRKTKSSKIG